MEELGYNFYDAIRDTLKASEDAFRRRDYNQAIELLGSAIEDMRPCKRFLEDLENETQARLKLKILKWKEAIGNSIKGFISNREAGPIITEMGQVGFKPWKYEIQVLMPTIWGTQ